MAKVTNKLQITIPKALADQCGIKPGDDVELAASGDGLRITPSGARAALPVALRLDLFDRATARQANRRHVMLVADGDSGRGWTREELYRRGSSR
jgi:AbrB family looped-hinge helix DNA binding protein